MFRARWKPALRGGAGRLLGIAVVVLFGRVARADTIFVPNDYPTIQQAIDAASDGDEIVVAPGDYNESINTLRKEIHLRSSDGPDVTTIIAAPDSAAIMVLSSAHDDIIIEGFTVTGGTGYPFDKFDSYGGGMYINASHPTVINCVFTRNSATALGGGVANIQADPTFIDCLFFDNLAAEGGGMVNGLQTWQESSPTLINCTFQENYAGDADWGDLGGAMAYGSPMIVGCRFIDNFAEDLGGAIAYGTDAVIMDCLFEGNAIASGPVAGGGAIHVVSGIIRDSIFISNETHGYPGGAIQIESNRLEISNSLFLRNQSGAGGAIFSRESRVTITNCTFWGNRADDDWGMALASVLSDVAVSNCILRDGGNEILDFDNQKLTVEYSNIEGGFEGEGNIDADPLFVDADGGYYRPSEGSPCIDAGDNEAVPQDLFDLDVDDDTEEPIPFDISGAPRFVDHPATEDTGRCELRCGLPIVDMGAYEFQPIGGCVRSPQWICDGDVDGDGQVNPVDAGLVQAAFGSTDETDRCQYDMDCDGQINPVDSGIVQALFGTCEPPREVCP
jgi:hypothetical protein